jgi:hypothetical protein
MFNPAVHPPSGFLPKFRGAGGGASDAGFAVHWKEARGSAFIRLKNSKYYFI